MLATFNFFLLRAPFQHHGLQAASYLIVILFDKIYKKMTLLRLSVMRRIFHCTNSSVFGQKRRQDRHGLESKEWVNSELSGIAQLSTRGPIQVKQCRVKWWEVKSRNLSSTLLLCEWQYWKIFYRPFTLIYATECKMQCTGSEIL